MGAQIFKTPPPPGCRIIRSNHGQTAQHLETRETSQTDSQIKWTRPITPTNPLSAPQATSSRISGVHSPQKHLQAPPLPPSYPHLRNQRDVTSRKNGLSMLNTKQTLPTVAAYSIPPTEESRPTKHSSKQTPPGPPGGGQSALLKPPLRNPRITKMTSTVWSIASPLAQKSTSERLSRNEGAGGGSGSGSSIQITCPERMRSTPLALSYCPYKPTYLPQVPTYICHGVTYLPNLPPSMVPRHRRRIFPISREQPFFVGLHARATFRKWSTSLEDIFA